MTDFASPVGRLVQGSVLRGNTKDRKGNPLVDKNGQPRTNFFIAVAFAKTAASAGGAWWNEGEFFANIYREGMRGYPQFFNADGSCKKRDFSWKIIDGDGVDDDGNPNSQKPGFAGHWVARFSNGFAPKLWMNGAYCTIEDAVKTGYFVRVVGDMKDNSPSESPGVYLNHNGVEFCAYGAEIVTGPNVGAVFSQLGAPAALPAGATLTPPTPTGPTANGMPQMPGGAPGAMPAMPAAQMPAMPGGPGVPQFPTAAAAPIPMPGAPAMPAMPASMPAPAGVVPNHQFVQNVAAMPAMPPAMPAAPAVPTAPQYQMTAKATGFTREQMHGAGWSDDALIANGMMVRVA